MRIRLAAAAVTTLALLGLAGPGLAHSAHWQQPYGGCEEGTLAPHSAGANECRAHGWTIRRRLAVNDRGTVVGSGLPHCVNEDGSGQRAACSWNFHDGSTDGNGEGLSYWFDRHDRIHYVWPRPARYPWMPVSQSLADALAEGDQPGRHWHRCRTTGVKARVIRVACPDGYHQAN